MGEIGNTKFLSPNLKGRNHLEDLGMNGRIKEWTLQKQGVKVQTGAIYLRRETSSWIL
jgi:hypothetical protein